MSFSYEKVPFAPGTEPPWPASTMIVRSCAFCCAEDEEAVKKYTAMKMKVKMKLTGFLIIVFKSFSYGQSSHNLNCRLVTFAHYLLMSDGRKNSPKYTSPFILCGLLTLITMIFAAND